MSVHVELSQEEAEELTSLLQRVGSHYLDRGIREVAFRILLRVQNAQPNTIGGEDSAGGVSHVAADTPTPGLPEPHSSYQRGDVKLRVFKDGTAAFDASGSGLSYRELSRWAELFRSAADDMGMMVPNAVVPHTWYEEE